jgi:predicted O-methyltransferase YrrM
VRHRILGEYETEIGEKISEIHDENTDYWEVGVGWGYHSLSIVDTVNQVIGFDPDTWRTDLVRKSCNKNNFENISLVTDEVDSLDSHLDEFGYLDVVLIDIDGWEYNVISNSPKLLEHVCK